MSTLLQTFRIGTRFLFRSEAVSAAPLRVWIEPTAACNLQCTFCPTGLGQVPPGKLMTKDTFERVLKLFPNPCNLNLHHRGEPTLHPEIAAMAGALVSRGHHVRMHTNATRLTESLRKKLFDSGLQLLSISFDGPDKERFERMRVGANHEDVVVNIQALLTERDRNNASMQIQLELIGFDDLKIPERVEEQIQELVAPQRLDRVIVREPHNWGDQDAAKTPSENKHSGSDTKDAGVNDNECSPPRFPCPHLWSTLAILADGTVSPCAQDYAGKLNLGNVNTDSLEEIWNGDRMRSLRRAHACGKIEDIDPCATCDVPRRQGSGRPAERLRTWISERRNNSKLPKGKNLSARTRLSLASPKKASKINALKKALPPLGRWLEVGSGAGVQSWALQDGREWVYLEEDSALRAYANDLLKTAPQPLSNLNELPVDRFDGILLSDHLEHVQDDSGLIKSCLRVLKPSGVLVVTVPAADRALYALRRRLGLKDEDLGHVREGYTPENLKTLLEAEGAEVFFQREFCGPFAETVEAILNALHRASFDSNGRPSFELPQTPTFKARVKDWATKAVTIPLKAVHFVDNLTANSESGYGVLMMAYKKKKQATASDVVSHQMKELKDPLPVYPAGE